MPKAKRRLKNLRVDFISLVDKAANRREVVFKRDNPAPESERNFKKQFSIRKLDDEKQLVFGIVYAPDESDTYGDTMEAAEIEKAAHDFLGAGKTSRVDKNHDNQADRGFVVESYIIGKNDSRFPDDPEGAWAVVIKVTDEDAWEEIKSGELTGLSMEGLAEAEPIAKAQAEQGVLDVIIKGVAKLMRGDSDPDKSDLIANEDPGHCLFIDAVKAAETDGLASIQVKKDFNSTIAGRQLVNAVSALDNSCWNVVHNEYIVDKISALKTNIEQFIMHLDGLQVSKSQQHHEETMSTVETKKEQAENVEAATAKTAKADDTQEPNTVEALLSDLTKSVKEIGERLEKVEKSSGGEQAILGRDNNTDPENTERTKKSAGIQFFPEG